MLIVQLEMRSHFLNTPESIMMRRKTYERAKEKNDVLAVHTLLLSFKYLSSLEQMCVCLNFDKKKRIICVLFIVMVITFSFICSSLSLSLSLSPFPLSLLINLSERKNLNGTIEEAKLMLILIFQFSF